MDLISVGSVEVVIKLTRLEFAIELLNVQYQIVIIVTRVFTRAWKIASFAMMIMWLVTISRVVSQGRPPRPIVGYWTSKELVIFVSLGII